MNIAELYEKPALYLGVAALLLAIGVFGLVRRRTLVGMLISGEIIFSAASLNFMALGYFFADPATGQIFTLFIMGLAAAEVAIALSIIIAVYRNFHSITTAGITELKG